MAKRNLLICLIALATGCPGPDAQVAEPNAAAAQPQTRTVPTEVPEARVSEPVATQAEGATGHLARAELLALNPADVLADGLRGDGALGLAPRLVGEGTLACAEQLRAEETPRAALELCAIAFHRARDPLAAGERMSEGDAERLARVLAVQSGGQPRLAAWTEALASHAVTREDLEACIAFLERVRAARSLVDALRQS